MILEIVHHVPAIQMTVRRDALVKAVWKVNIIAIMEYAHLVVQIAVIVRKDALLVPVMTQGHTAIRERPATTKTEHAKLVLFA